MFTIFSSFESILEWAPWGRCHWQRSREIKIVGTGSCNFSTDSCKFPTEEIMDAQNFNFAPKFSQNVGFSAPNFAFLDKTLPSRRKIFDSPKFSGVAIAVCFSPTASLATVHRAMPRSVGVRRQWVATLQQQQQQLCRWNPACCQRGRHAEAGRLNAAV